MLEGMFAFAVYDVRRRELLLARDRLGKKPLFYAELDGALHFASEIKALRASPAWDPTLDLSAARRLSVARVLPRAGARRIGTSASCCRDTGCAFATAGSRVRQYWDVERVRRSSRHRQELEDEIEATLRSAVVDRLESEVPLGAFLSGGIDSGLVVSFMAEALGAGRDRRRRSGLASARTTRSTPRR